MPVLTSPLPSKSRIDLCASVLYWRERVENSDPYMSQLNDFAQQYTSSYAPNSQRVCRMSGVSADSQQASKRAALYDPGIQQPVTPNSNNESLPHQDYPAPQSHPRGPEPSSSAPGMKPPQAGVDFLDMWGEPKIEHSTVGYENDRPQHVAEDDSLRQNHYQRMSGSGVAGAPNTRSGPRPVNVIPFGTYHPPPMNYLQTQTPPLVPMLPGNRHAPHVTSPLAVSTLPNPDPVQLEVLKIQLERERIYWARVGEFVTNVTTLFQSGARGPSWFEASVQEHAQIPAALQSVISTPAPPPASFPSAPSSVSFSAPGGA